MSQRFSKFSNRKTLRTEGGDDDAASANGDDPPNTTNSDGGESCGTSASMGTAPLQNSVILQHLFEICPVDLLATCRLVCKQWYDESLLTWRRALPLRFGLADGHVVMKCVGSDRLARTIPLRSFRQYAVDPTHQVSRKPFRNVQIENSVIGAGRASRRRLGMLWSLLGDNLTTLELMRCTFPDGDEFRSIIFVRCPNLQCLVINSCQFSTARDFSIQEPDPLACNEQPSIQNNHLKVLKIVVSDDESRLPVSWFALFSRFPLISSLTVDECDQTEFVSLTNAIRSVRKRDRKLLPLKFFDVCRLHFPAGALTNQRLVVLQELRLPVQNVLVELEAELAHAEVRDAIAPYANTLKDIYLIEDFSAGSPFLLGYQLDNLLDLTLCSDSYDTFSFLRHTPNLEYLSLESSDGVSTITISSICVDEPEPMQMKNLRRAQLQCWVNDSHIGRLRELMPNLTELSICLNDRKFGIVCENWRMLKTIRVFGNQLTDQGVTGVKNEKGPNITYLKDLTEFGFESGRLSDRSVFQGLLLLPKLRAIWNFGTDPVQWERRTRRELVHRNIQLHGHLKYP